MKKTLTYDDVQIVPKYSELEHRGDIELEKIFQKYLVKNWIIYQINRAFLELITNLKLKKK